MAWFPDAIRREIPPGANDPEIVPVGLILHVDAGDNESLYDYFNGRSGGIESTFHVPKDGPPEQYRSTGYEADANYKGNSFVGSDGRRYGFLSVETQGLGKGRWNANQLYWIKRIIRWSADTHELIHPRICPGPYEAGVGYHVMFGAPGPWTPVAKSCPGPLRIKQFDNDIAPWLNDGAPDPEEEMSAEAERKIDALYEVLCNGNSAMGRTPGGAEVSVRYLAQETLEDTDDMPRRVWRRRLPWWGSWEERWSGLAENYENGYAAEALLVHAYGRSRQAVELLFEVRELNRVQIDAYEGKDTHAILNRIDQRAAEQRQRDQNLSDRLDALSAQADDMMALLDEFESGALDAAQVVQQLVQLKAEMYTKAAGGDE